MAGLTYDLDSVFRSVDDLDKAQAALVRERAIRDTMAKTGEERQHVADMLDAMESMGQEAVLDLTEGEPTTLRNALQRYVESLEEEDGRSSDPVELGPYAMSVVESLATLLAYPFPGACENPCEARPPCLSRVNRFLPPRVAYFAVGTVRYLL